MSMMGSAGQFKRQRLPFAHELVGVVVPLSGFPYNLQPILFCTFCLAANLAIWSQKLLTGSYASPD